MMFDSKTYKILSTLHLNPLNLMEISRATGIPYSTLRRRINKLRTQIRVFARPDYWRLGLAPMVYLLPFSKKDFDVFSKAYYTRSLIKFFHRGGRKLFVYLTIPMEFKSIIDVVLRSTAEVYFADEVIEMTSPKEFKPEVDWEEVFNIVVKTEEKKIEIAKEEVFDVKDLLIIRELEKDSLITFKNIAETVGISEELCLYHYYRHIIERKLIKEFTVRVKISKEEIPSLLFIIEAKRNITGLIKGFQKIHYVEDIYLTRNKYILVQIQLPSSYWVNLFRLLDRLQEEDIVKEYDVLVQDPKVCLELPLNDKAWNETHRRWMIDPVLEEIIRSRRKA